MTRVFLDSVPMIDLEGQVDQLVRTLAGGLKAGDPCAIQIRDNYHFLLAYCAVARVGGIPIVVSSTGNPVDTASYAGAIALISWSSAKAFQVIFLECTGILSIPSDTAVIFQTSGTTSRSKFVRWTKKGVDFVSEATKSALQYTQADRLLITMPLSGAYGLSILHIWQRLAMGLVLASSSRPAHLSSICRATQATSFDAAPQLYHVLNSWLDKKPARRKDWGSVRIWCCGGDTLKSDLAYRWSEMMEMPILDGYGLSEAGPNVALSTPSDNQIGSVGRALPGVKCRVSDDGELQILTDGAMGGYWPPSEMMAGSVFVEGGWLKTGDAVSIDSNGYIFIRGRLKNVIVVNGNNFYPEELEESLSVDPMIEQTVAVQLEGRRGQEIGIVLVPSEHASASRQSDWARIFRERLPNVPIGKVMCADKIPTTLSGKIDRAYVAEMLGRAKNSKHRLQFQ